MRPFIDKVMPEAWGAATEYSTAIRAAALARGVTEQEIELIKVRVSQLNRCAFCLDLHSRQAREHGIAQQQLDLLPAWRETSLFTMREEMMLAVAEAVTALPLTEDASADLAVAHDRLGDDVFAAAEWVALTINAFNRISILSEHPVCPRDGAGNLPVEHPRKGTHV